MVENNGIAGRLQRQRMGMRQPDGTGESAGLFGLRLVGRVMLSVSQAIRKMFPHKLAQDDDWITMKGAHVLVCEGGEIKAEAGGKFTGLGARISEAEAQRQREERNRKSREFLSGEHDRMKAERKEKEAAARERGEAKVKEILERKAAREAAEANKAAEGQKKLDEHQAYTARLQKEAAARVAERKVTPGSQARKEIDKTRAIEKRMDEARAQWSTPVRLSDDVKEHGEGCDGT